MDQTFPLLGRAGESFRKGMITARRLDNQYIDGTLGKDGRFGKCLIVEVDVAGVENRASLRTQQDAGGAEHMTRVEEFKIDAASLRRVSFA